MTPDEHQQEVQPMIPNAEQVAPAAYGTAGVRPAGSPPSPRPRPTPHPVPNDTPSDVTVSDSPVSSEDSESPSDADSALEKGVEVSSLQSSLHLDLDTLRERLRSGWAGLREYVTPPSVLTQAPASVAELRAYARWGAWTRGTDGAVRNLGIAWYRLVGLPATVLCRYAEWIWQRPGRAVPVLLLWKLLISTGPGPWAVDHLIRPVLGVFAWVLL